MYQVERDDLSLTTLARYYSTSSAELKQWNPWLSSDWLEEGEELIIYKSPEAITFYKARTGDSLWELAKRYNTTISNLKRWNQLKGSKIYPGSRLIVGLK